MRRSLLPLALAFICAHASACGEPIEGNGEPGSEQRTVAAFTELSSDNGVEVRVHVGENASDEAVLELSADENLLGYIETRVSAGELLVDAPSALRPVLPLVIETEIADLAVVEVNNSAVVTATGVVTALTAVANNGGELFLGELTAATADVDLNNGGEATLCVSGKITGRVANGAELRVSCGGDASGVETSSGGSVE